MVSGSPWAEHEYVEIKTIGVDIGSATSHFLISRLGLARRSQALSAKFDVVARKVEWRSDVLLTPYVIDAEGRTLIDAEHLGRFLKCQLARANVAPRDIETGAVILTGEALKGFNARAIADRFAHELGHFLVASAGHELEADIAARGSGAVSMSAASRSLHLHLDVGGGTTKVALISGGDVLARAAYWVGSRVVTVDGDRIADVQRPAAYAASEWLGLELRTGQLADVGQLEAISDLLVEQLMMRVFSGRAFGRSDAGDTSAPSMPSWMALTDALPAVGTLDAITVSGGVAEYVYGRADDGAEHGDLGPFLARALRARLEAEGLAPLLEPAEGLRATVMGASQYTVEMSGNTVYVSDAALLPMRDVPVVRPDVDMGGAGLTTESVASAVEVACLPLVESQLKRGVALALRWAGTPDRRRLVTISRGVVGGLLRSGLREAPVVVLVDGDVGRVLGHVIDEECSPTGGTVSLDGLECRLWDYVDIGHPVGVAKSIPVVVKTMMFAS